VLLSELKIGQDATVAKVGGKGPMRLRLLDMGLIPGTVVKIQKKAPLGDPIQINLRGYELTIRLADAENIAVQIKEHKNDICPDR
jgi:Fe2+ transport system protein FeoA